MPAAFAGYRLGTLSSQGVDWRLKRNCSVTPLQLCSIWGVFVVVSLAVAMGFWVQGAVLVLPFALLEILALTLAFVVFARHAADAESISFNGVRLEVQIESGGRIQCATFARESVRVEAQIGKTALVEVSGRGHSVLVGRHIRHDLRAVLVDEIRCALRGV